MPRFAWFFAGVVLACGLSGLFAWEQLNDDEAWGPTPFAELSRDRECRRGHTLIVGNSTAGNLKLAKLEAALKGPLAELWMPGSVAPEWYLTFLRCVEQGSAARRMLVIGSATGLLANQPVSDQALARSFSIATVHDPTLRARIAGGWPWWWVKVRSRSRSAVMNWRKELFQRAVMGNLDKPARRSPVTKRRREKVGELFGGEHPGLEGRVAAMSTGRSPHDSFLPEIVELARREGVEVGMVLMPGRPPGLGNHEVDVAAIQAFADLHEHVRVFDLRLAPVQASDFRDELHVEPRGRAVLTEHLLAELKRAGWMRRRRRGR